MTNSLNLKQHNVLYKIFLVSFSAYPVLGCVSSLKFKAAACKFIALDICLRSQTAILQELQSGFNVLNNVVLISGLKVSFIFCKLRQII